MKDLISIITPVYNSEKFLSTTIDSVISQNYSNWELILVDDCSQDESKKIIIEYMSKDTRIKGFFLENNSGVANARNKGIEMASGNYIAFLDSDDLWHKEKLTKQLHFMKENDYLFTYTNYELIDGEGKQLGKKIVSPPRVNYKRMLNGNPIGCLTVMYNCDVIKDVRMPKVGHEDYVTWLNILKRNVIAYGLQENLAYYRKFSESLSSNKFKAAKWTWKIYRREEKLSFFASIYHFLMYVINILKK